MPQPKHPKPPPPPETDPDNPPSSVAPRPKTGRVISEETSRRLIRNMLDQNKVGDAWPLSPLAPVVAIIFLVLLAAVILPFCR